MNKTKEAIDERLDLLKKEREARQETERTLQVAKEENNHLTERIAQLKQDMDLVAQDRDRITKDLDNAQSRAKAAEFQNKRYLALIRSERAFWKAKLQKPVMLPCVGMAVSAVLAFLIGAAVDYDLISLLLGEPLGYGALVVCAFFGGLVWDRAGGCKGREAHRK